MTVSMSHMVSLGTLVGVLGCEMAIGALLLSLGKAAGTLIVFSL